MAAKIRTFLLNAPIDFSHSKNTFYAFKNVKCYFFMANWIKKIFSAKKLFLSWMAAKIRTFLLKMHQSTFSHSKNTFLCNLKM